jgi:hypothetical protein
MSSRLDPSWSVLASHQTADASRCEDMGAWTPIRYFSGREHLTETEAIEAIGAARLAVPWASALLDSA